MKIIRYNDGSFNPLCIDWDISRCNFKNCIEVPNTIISDPDRDLTFGLCEEHFQMGNVPGGCEMKLEFNKFDAFQGGVINV